MEQAAWKNNPNALSRTMDSNVSDGNIGISYLSPEYMQPTDKDAVLFEFSRKYQ